MLISASGSVASTRGPFLERHFHAGMAWLFVIVAVAGFAPRSLAIVSGMMPSPPLVVHLHAAVMASWVSLLAVQATRSLAGRMDLHRKWGAASLVVAPLVLIMLIAGRQAPVKPARIRSAQTQFQPTALGVAANKHRAVLCKRQLAATYGTTSSRPVMSGVFP
jgi:hypothetical protein